MKFKKYYLNKYQTVDDYYFEEPLLPYARYGIYYRICIQSDGDVHEIFKKENRHIYYTNVGAKMYKEAPMTKEDEQYCQEQFQKFNKMEKLKRL